MSDAPRLARAVFLDGSRRIRPRVDVEEPLSSLPAEPSAGAPQTTDGHDDAGHRDARAKSLRSLTSAVRTDAGAAVRSAHVALEARRSTSAIGAEHERLVRLSESEVLRHHRHGTLPERWTMHVAPAGIVTFGETLVLERAPQSERPSHVQPGDAVCMISGPRLAFRRVIGRRGSALRVRCDVAPFAEDWDGPVLGRVVPRVLDKVARAAPALWTEANWQGAMALVHAMAIPRKIKRRGATSPFRTELLSEDDWPKVRAFCLAASGRPLPSEAHEKQHVVGMLLGDELLGFNIHLVSGTSSYSAYTLVHPKYRGMGGGRMMIAHGIRFARARRLERIYVHIDARNLASIAAYRANGFEFTGWWSDDADPLAAAERQWRVFERVLSDPVSDRADRG